MPRLDLNLVNLADYASRTGEETLRQKVDRALAELTRNIDSQLHPATAKRKVVITIEAEPDEERRDVRVLCGVETKFPAERPAPAMVYLNTDAQTGETYATVGASVQQGELPLVAADAKPDLRPVPKAQVVNQ